MAARRKGVAPRRTGQLLNKGGKRFRLCVRKVLGCYATLSRWSREKLTSIPPFLRRTEVFLGSLQAYILTETEKVDCAEQGPSEECYIIYRNAFGKEKGISRLIESCWHCYRNQGWVCFQLVLCPFAAEWHPLQWLTFSEAVEDIIYNYRKVEPSNESKCLALAQVAYGQSGTHKNSAEPCVLTSSSAPTGMRVTVSDLKAPPACPHTQDALGQIILNDTICTLEDWNKIAVSCAENKHEKLSEKIVLILTYQDGVFEDLPLEGEKGARIMGHVFRWYFCVTTEGALRAVKRRILLALREPQ
ncbi:clathrin heavy chain linker domain-containing protein 1 [Falco naumanni]|uniref:clathrin heavy chain linker domain-containing protein 1 n=1 Tax=Falco naumanni TaxID=148594 RepID=UPI001ADE8D4D|nr:clathrin heavy chain linker domain-containing protein 1 [Falco naumanni]